MQSNQLNEQIPADALKRGFEGIWIPAEIWLDDNLHPLERVLYAEIASFGKKGCWKKSEDLMSLLSVSKGTFQKYCRNLRERGYITERRAFGRIIRTTTLAFQSTAQKLHQTKNCADEQHKNCADERTKNCAVHKEYSKNNSNNKLLLEHRQDDVPVEKSKKIQYGNSNVNELFDYWEQHTGIKPSNNKANRNSCATLIRQRGVSGAKIVIDNITKALNSQDKYAPRISSFTELYGAYGKLSKLDAWIIKNSPKTALKRFQTAQKTYLDDDYEPTDEERAETLAKMKEFRRKMPF